MAQADDIDIELIDRIDKGLIIHFTNGESVLYHAAFLYDVRTHDGNRPLPSVAEHEE